MLIKKGISLTALGIGVLVLIGCSMVSDRTKEQLVQTDATKPTTIATATSLRPTPSPSTATTLQPITTQTVAPGELCEMVPEPVLDHSPDNSGEKFLSGRFYLCDLPPFSVFDFDEGKMVDEGNEEGDLHLELGKATFDNHIIYYLWEENASLVEEAEFKDPSYAECEALISSPIRLSYVIGTLSGSGCIQTNKGRLGFFQVTKVDPYGVGSLEVSFIIWNERE